MRQDIPPNRGEQRDTFAELNKRFFDSKDMSDVTFICSDEKEIPAHRYILAARSSVFHRMLTTDMMEKDLNKIEVDDIDSATMHELLRYIYTHKVKNIDQLAAKLLYAAEKYDLPELKSFCAAQMIKQLSSENVFESLVLADRLNEHKMLRKCMEYIRM
jgi:speckle-type POZ protein